jgi:LAO/AO transport system kinase
MATRGELGGLATTTREVCDVLDACGFDRIIVETVGVGQSELAIAGTADTAVLVLVPESGDGVQVLKAGVMEVADVYVVNKADRPGADRLRQEIEVMLGIRQGNAYRHVRPHHRLAVSGAGAAASGPPVWDPPVLTTVATAAEGGVDDVVDAIERHAAALAVSGELAQRRTARLERHTRGVVERALRERVWNAAGEARLRDGMDSVAAGRMSPYQLAQDILARQKEAVGHDA